MDSFNQTKEAFLSKKPPFLDILGFEDCSFDKSNEEFSCIFVPSIKMTHSLSLIHISEPTRPERIGGCGVGG